jgi:hypothetical protein
MNATVPISRRDDILSEMRRILDARSSRTNWRVVFLRAVLAHLGIDRSAAKSLLLDVPADPKNVDVEQLLIAIERAGFLIWRHEAIVVAGVELRDALIDVCVRVLSKPSRSSMPQPVARELAKALRDAAHPYFDHLELYSLLEDELVRRMWRSRGSERPLAMRIVRVAAKAASLQFTDAESSSRTAVRSATTRAHSKRTTRTS